MIILGAASLLLFSYKGYERCDDILNTITGFAGLGICLFPMANGVYEYIGTFQILASVSNVIHLVSAVVFFVLLSINSLFLFTKSSGDMTKRKRIRNIIFIICGIGMLCAFALLLVPPFPCRTWWIEAIALFFFGISWLTKANYYPWLFADPKGE